LGLAAGAVLLSGAEEAIAGGTHCQHNSALS